MGIYQGAMDIGTNSCRLIIVEKKEEGDFTHLRQVRITRIGEGLGQGHLRLSQGAMDRTLAALAEYKEMLGGYPVEEVWLLGTQALREADNSEVFAAAVKERTGFDLQIISGEREAYLSYLGAATGLSDPALAQPLVLDIGAGSTELMWLEEDGAAKAGDTGAAGIAGTNVAARAAGAKAEAAGVGGRGDDADRNIGAIKGRIRAVSAPIGSLRLLEKPLDRQGILEALRTGWQGIAVPERAMGGNAAAIGGTGPLVGVGGTATTLGAIHLNMKEYDPEALLGLEMSRSQVEAVLALLESLPSAERLALPGMMPGREDVLPWGLRILLAAMTYCRRDSVVICDRDLLYGILQ